VDSYLFILKPVSPTLTKRHDVTDLFFHSDTLSSALLSVAANAGEDVDNLVQQGWFRVSSILPAVYKGSGWCVFYPMPDIFKEALKNRLDYKLAKNIVFADDEFLKWVIQGREEQFRGQVYVKGRELRLLDLSKNQEEVHAWVSVRMGLAVDRVSGGPIQDMLFEVGDIITAHTLRLAIIAKVEPEKISKFEEYLRLLGMAGIGSSRSRGRGQFDVLLRQRFVPPDFGSDSKAHLLLSLWHPTRGEFAKGFMAKSFYRLIQRGGYVTKAPYMTLRRNPVTMLSEGSVIVGDSPIGEWLTVLKAGEAKNLPYSVYRDGRATSIPIRLPLSLRGAP